VGKRVNERLNDGAQSGGECRKSFIFPEEGSHKFKLRRNWIHVIIILVPLDVNYRQEGRDEDVG
jgi:hypothetical protein